VAFVLLLEQVKGASIMKKVFLFSLGLLLAVPAASVQARPDDQRGYGEQRGYGDQRGRSHFDNRDRDEVSRWYRGHQRALPVGLRGRDRLPPAFERRFGVGVVLDAGWRGYMHPVPRELAMRLTPVPYGYRYTLIGGRVCVVDNRYRVVDELYVGFGR
jgi:hypothetical protein